MLLGTTCRPETGPGVLRIATAANMQYAMEEICNNFTKDTGYTCQVLVGSSGKLSAQIRQGAPYDVMVSADLKYPQYLFEQGLAKAPPRVYARGKLALWSMEPEMKLSLTCLSQPEVHRIALANPETAPYGKAALEVLKNHGLLQEVKHKLIFGESISQVNQFVESGAAEVGFTAGSVKYAPPVQGKGQWLSLEDSSYKPILQAAILLSAEDTYPEQAMEFYEYLFSDRARSVLKNYGYAVDE
jgi:molybdate transport system substrate-binding protein